ncbi:MAG: hypothetical protein BJ554DRAFT_115 [Olpidium bornovanus]|uniref:DNA-directed RNA polymerases I, II, and III subunit RPABC5 n=1 Tax=Olpidium bornovanus TaxID=278681 RepID=A0A8H7ZTS6_9FUNG|nr:MAG: hypothetical protein BJ554DRAFT_115 [Olpidium bornovanus]
MLIPVRCFSCGKVSPPGGDDSARDRKRRREGRRREGKPGVACGPDFALCAVAVFAGNRGYGKQMGDILVPAAERLHGRPCAFPDNREALDALNLKRYCCRRMVLTHVDLIEKLLHYNRAWLRFGFSLARSSPLFCFAAGFFRFLVSNYCRVLLRDAAVTRILLRNLVPGFSTHGPTAAGFLCRGPPYAASAFFSRTIVAHYSAFERSRFRTMQAAAVGN